MRADIKARQIDAVVVGAGCVGLLTACALALESQKHCKDARMSVMVLESAPTLVNYDHRLLSIALDVYMFLGDLGVKVISATPVTHILVTDGYNTFSLKDTDHHGTPYGFMVPLHKLQHALYTRAIELGVKVCFEARVEALDCAHDSYGQEEALLQVSRSGTTSLSLKAGLLVAADGKGSSVRTLTHMRHTIQSYNHDALVTDVALGASHHNAAAEYLTPYGALGLLPTSHPYQASCVLFTPRYLAVDEQLHKKHRITVDAMLRSAGQMPNIMGEHLRYLKPVGNMKRYAIERIAAFSAYKGNVMFVGDALCAIHPILGQGLNMHMRYIRKNAGLMGVYMHKIRRKEPRDLGFLRSLDMHQYMTEFLMHAFAHQHSSVVLRAATSWGLRMCDQSHRLKSIVGRHMLGLLFEDGSMSW